MKLVETTGKGLIQTVPAAEAITDKALAEFTKHLAKSNPHNLTVGYYGSRVYRMLLGLPPKAGSDLDMAYGVCDMRGEPVRPFTLVNARARKLRSALNGFKPASYSGKSPFIHPWISYFNAQGGRFKPGSNPAAPELFEAGYTVGNILLVTDGRDCRLIDYNGGVADLLSRVIRLNPSARKSVKEKCVDLALRGVKLELEYGMRFEPESERLLQGAMRSHKFIQDDYQSDTIVESLAKVISVSAPKEKIRDALQRFSLHGFARKVFEIGERHPVYHKIKHYAGVVDSSL